MHTSACQLLWPLFMLTQATRADDEADGRHYSNRRRHARSYADTRRGNNDLITPCVYPVPPDANRYQVESRSGAVDECQTEFHQLPYVCDPDNVVYLTEAMDLNETVADHLPVLFNSSLDQYRLGIAVLDQLKMPPSHTAIWEDKRFKCLGHLEPRQVGEIADSTETYMRTFAQVLHSRWFAATRDSSSENACDQLNVLIVMFVNGANSAGYGHSMFAFDAGRKCRARAQYIIKDLKRFANEQLKTNQIKSVIPLLIDRVGLLLAEDWQAEGDRKHSVPDWAVKMFAGSFCLVVMSVLAEWVVVRRNTGIKRSAASQAASATGVSSTNAKTHMMF